MILQLFVLFVALAAHELGHYGAAIIFDAHPKFYIKNGALMMHSEPPNNIAGKIITIAGIIAGFVPLYVFRSWLSIEMILVLSVVLIIGSHIDFKLLGIDIRKTWRSDL